LTFAPSPDPPTPTVNGTHPPRVGAGEVLSHPVAPSRATPLHAKLATWILTKEIGAAADTADVAQAAERVCFTLVNRLSRMVGPAGSRTLLARALHLSRANHPFLEHVRAGTLPEPCLGGLEMQTADVEAHQMRNAVLTILGTLLDLLVGFIGEDLTRRLVRELWPDLPLKSGRPGNADGQEVAS
jgi:hypothetical protein